MKKMSNHFIASMINQKLLRIVTQASSWPLLFGLWNCLLAPPPEGVNGESARGCERRALQLMRSLSLSGEALQKCQTCSWIVIAFTELFGRTSYVYQLLFLQLAAHCLIWPLEDPKILVLTSKSPHIGKVNVQGNNWNLAIVPQEYLFARNFKQFLVLQLFRTTCIIKVCYR